VKIYKISKIVEATTSTGKPYKKVDIVSEDGDNFKFVPYWSSLPGYDALAVGSKFEATIESKQNGQYTNYSINLANMPQKSAGGGMPAKMMERKEATINKVLDRKEGSISAAQTRNELMWAKYGACEIIAHHVAYKSLKGDEIVGVIEALTADILNISGKHEFDQSDEFKQAIAKDDEKDEIRVEDIPF
jgi:hypothetical protein